VVRNTSATLSGTTKVILDWVGLAAWALGIWLAIVVLGHTLENEADSKHWGQLVLALLLTIGGFVMIELTGDRLGFVFKAIGTVLSPIIGLFR
jgi:membrane protein DedA with SNARE-associated domain